MKKSPAGGATENHYLFASGGRDWGYPPDPPTQRESLRLSALLSRLYSAAPALPRPPALWVAPRHRGLSARAQNKVVWVQKGRPNLLKISFTCKLQNSVRLLTTLHREPHCWGWLYLISDKIVLCAYAPCPTEPMYIYCSFHWFGADALC